MAQEDKPQKKRGRPSLEDKNAEKTTEDAPKSKKQRGRPSLERNQDEQEPGPEAIENGISQKRKRGRPALRKNKNDDAPEPEPEQETVEEEAQAKKKRGRAKKNQDIEEPEQQPAETEKQPKRKRGRPAQEKDQNDKEPEQEVADDSEKQRRKKNTKGNQVEQPDGQQEEELEPEPEGAQPAPRKKRQRKAPEPEPEPEDQEPEEEEQQSRRSPRNSSSNDREDINNKGRKAGKSKKTSQENTEDQQPDDATKKRERRKGGKPQAKEADEPEPEPEQQQQDTSKKKRRNKNDVPSDSDESLPSPPKPYLHIAPFKRTIRSSHIAAKWSPLTGSSLPAATSILTLAQRPILQRTATTRNRRDHATAALNLVSRRIERKLDRGVPFPPASSKTSTRRPADADGGRAMELDFEAVLDGKQALERQLHPGKHAVELLKAERDRMEKELENDYAELRGLEANARAQMRERKDLFRRAHVLAPTSPPKKQAQDTQFVANKDEGSLKELLDTSLEPIALQLAGHVDSIRGNLQQAEGVTPQLNRTKAALQEALQQYLDSDTYEQILLG